MAHRIASHRITRLTRTRPGGYAGGGGEAGSIIVTTPHTLAVQDATRGLNMFRKVGAPVLGLVENMAAFVCPGCGAETSVFGSRDRTRALCADHDVEFLGALPLHPSVADDAQRGRPTVVAEPDSSRAAAFVAVARRVADKIGLPASEPG